jgi:hypothetical protein
MRVNPSFVCLALSFILTSSCSAFFLTATQNVHKPELVHFTSAPTGTLLNFHLDVGKEGESRLCVNDLLIELRNDIVENGDSNKNHLLDVYRQSLQPQSQYSSGVRQLNLLQQGHYVDMTGANYLDTINGCWEIVWRDGAAAGVLVCRFDLTKDYRRNDAILSKGPLFLSFPVWTRETLNQKQEHKRTYETLAKQLDLEHEQEMEKMHATDNVFMKAWHYRSAADARRKHISEIPHRQLSQIPSDDEIISLDDGLYLSNKGLVWSRDGFQPFGGDGVVSGSAVVRDGGVSRGSKDDLGSKKVSRGLASLPSLTDNV